MRYYHANNNERKKVVLKYDVNGVGDLLKFYKCLCLCRFALLCFGDLDRMGNFD